MNPVIIIIIIIVLLVGMFSLFGDGDDEFDKFVKKLSRVNDTQNKYDNRTTTLFDILNIYINSESVDVFNSKIKKKYVKYQANKIGNKNNKYKIDLNDGFMIVIDIESSKSHQNQDFEKKYLRDIGNIYFLVPIEIFLGNSRISSEFDDYGFFYRLQEHYYNMMMSCKNIPDFFDGDDRYKFIYLKYISNYDIFVYEGDPQKSYPIQIAFFYNWEGGELLCSVYYDTKLITEYNNHGYYIFDFNNLKNIEPYFILKYKATTNKHFSWTPLAEYIIDDVGMECKANCYRFIISYLGILIGNQPIKMKYVKDDYIRINNNYKKLLELSKKIDNDNPYVTGGADNNNPQSILTETLNSILDLINKIKDYAFSNKKLVAASTAAITSGVFLYAFSDKIKNSFQTIKDAIASSSNAEEIRKDLYSQVMQIVRNLFNNLESSTGSSEFSIPEETLNGPRKSLLSFIYSKLNLLTKFLGLPQFGQKELPFLGSLSNSVTLLTTPTYDYPSFDLGSSILSEMEIYSNKWIRRGDEFVLQKGGALQICPFSENTSMYAKKLEYCLSSQDKKLEDKCREIMEINFQTNLVINETAKIVKSMSPQKAYFILKQLGFRLVEGHGVESVPSWLSRIREDERVLGKRNSRIILRMAEDRTKCNFFNYLSILVNWLNAGLGL